MSNCANEDYLLLFTSLKLKTLEAYKIVIFKSTSLKLGVLIRKLYVYIKKCINLENPISSKSVDKMVQTEIILFLPNYSLEIVNFRSTSLKLGLLNQKL